MQTSCNVHQVLVLHLDPNFYAPGSVVKYDKYFGNLYTLRVPSNVLALPINETRQVRSPDVLICILYRSQLHVGKSVPMT